uniref:Integrase catalytic domain-containing protein n=1 Tax=Fagus sylvatica TaxID=28930 RepID=A0A2N9GLY1_FAGSY
MRMATISAIPLARQTRNKQQNHKNGKNTTKDKREPEDNMRRVNTDQPTMVPTPSARQTRVKQRRIHEKGRSSTRDKRCFNENMNKGGLFPKRVLKSAAQVCHTRWGESVCGGYFVDKRAFTADPYFFPQKPSIAADQEGVHHQPSGKLKGLQTRSAVMPPRSRRQNSVVNSHPDTESNAHNQAVGGAQQNNGGNMEGGGIPEGELAESIRQLKESSNNREAHGGNGRNHEERDHHDERDSNNKNDAPFVTMSDVADLLKQERERPPKEPRHFVRKPPYPKELLKEPYPEKYDTPNFSLFDGRKGSAVEHISKFLDSMGPFAGNGGLCLREFSKSLVDRAYTWYAMLPEGSIRDWEDMVESFCSKYFHVEEKITLLNLHSTKQLPGEDLLKYIHRFQDISLDCHVKYEESELVEVCIDNMLPEFRVHLENLDISQFAPLLQKARKTALSVKPHSEKARERKSQHQALTVSTTTAPSGNKRKRPIEKVFEEPPPLPFTVEEMMVIFDKWVKDEVIKLPQINKPPTEEEKRDPKFCRYHRYVHHPTADCRSLRWELNRKIQDGTLQLSPEQQRVHKNPFPNHRKDQGKAVVSVVIRGSTSDMEVDESAVADTTLTPAAVRTLQKSPKFKSLFNQLGLGPEARNAATEAIIAIAADLGATCFTAEAHASRTFLETTNAVTFTDEDMEVQYPDHRRPLYVSAVIKDVQVRRALVDTGSCLNLIPLSTLKAANIPQHKIQGVPIEVTEVPYHVLLGRPWLHKHKLISSTYHQCIKGRLNGKPIRIAANPSPFDQTEAHFIEAALYDELSTEEPPIIKPSGTPLPDWEDIRNDPDVDLREVLERKKKRKERMAEDENAPRCIRVQMPDGRIVYQTEGYKRLAVEKEEAKLEKSAAENSKLTPKEDLEVINLSHDPSIDKPVSISTSLSAVERACLINLLKEYQDVFAWKYDEMPGIDPGLVAHSLNVEPGTKPVVQPARTFHTEVEAQITQEVKKLLAAGFIKPIQHPRWLSNIVPVKKKNRQIRCCVDFRNLNKACPKDEFPLPNMDLLIDSAAGSAMFSFMDGFSGYNQIQMSPRDAGKTAFRTPIGNFYYTVMPFGLKNAGATYQRTMTAMFHDMIHQEIEDYVDDIVVKSKRREDHVEVLRKVFERCRLYKLKMNPLKCAFGVSAGKFLGFLVHNRGIDVDPAKASAIATMKPPTSHKELKSFLGRLSYIRRFIPGLAAVTSTFSHLLKKGVSFNWSAECQEAFERIQVIMTKLPTVCAPTAGKPLRLYLASNSQAIGALVAQEDDDGIEQPVYYVSRGLKDTETRYSVAERACLALVYASQRLRHYFLAHKIQLMTKSHPIRSLLQRPVLSGRLAQWLLQLSQYEISTETPTAIKSQAIADLLAQFPGEDNSIWTLNFDGSSTSVSSGAGVVLNREDGETIAKSFKLDFPCSNNASEYETYITGLAIAHGMGIKHLRVIGDSNLIICQAKGEFSLKEPSLAPYRTLAQRSIPITDLLREEYEQQDPDKEDWRTPLKSKLVSPKDVADLKALKDFVLISGDLYRRLPGGILARCVSPQEGTKKLQEVHEKSCELEGGVSLYRRLQRLGYFWPDMSKEAADLQRRCSTCQHQHENEQTGKEAARIKKLFTRYFVESGILFRKGFHGDPLRCLSLSESQTVMKEAHSGECGEHQGKKRIWPHHGLSTLGGLDLIGPINPPSGGYIWILAATEYFTKWVEAIPLRKATGAAVANFIREHIITRFGIPHKIISDNGTPFVNKDVREVLEHYRIKHRRSTPYYPQGNGQAEATNRMLLRILSKMVFDYGKGWNSHLADVLWAYRGSPKTATGFTPFSLVYGTDVISPPELLVPSPRILQGTELEADVEMCAEARVADLESLDESRELALARNLRYHQKLANAYGKTVHTRIFSQGQMVLKTADHVRRGLPSPSKFTPNWEGPYVIREAHDSGYYRLSKADGTILADPINGKWLKEYYS